MSFFLLDFWYVFKLVLFCNFIKGPWVLNQSFAPAHSILWQDTQLDLEGVILNSEETLTNATISSKHEHLSL